MTNITYRFLNGYEVGQWPGRGYRDDRGRCRRTGQIFLGKVIDKEHMIFWKRKEGYFAFDPDTCSMKQPDPKYLPDKPAEQDGRKKGPPVLVDFGDAYFLDRLLEEIGYLDVLKKVSCSNLDTLLSLISFYTLDSGVASRALAWHKQSYASYLYPKANLHEQRIAETLRKIGSPESFNQFISAHIKYILDNTDGDLSVLIDSTGLPNCCNLPCTRLSVHEGEVNLEFRLIAVIQKSTGLPLYYEYIEGNIVDISTLERTVLLMSEYGCKIQYCIGDAGYCSPGIMERLVLSGIDFMTRLNPAYKLFKDTYEKNREQLLNDSGECLTVRYGNRLVRIIREKQTVGYDKENNKPHDGYVYLCLDVQARASKIDHLLSSKKAWGKTTEELKKMMEKYGVFAIVSTRDIPSDMLLSEYYVRQSVEQYFDFGKNYANYLPVQQHSEETMRGHLLLSFISTFIFVLINNRFGTAGRSCVEIFSDQNVCEQVSVPYTNDLGESKTRIVMKQTPAKVSDLSAKWIFSDLRGQKANVFDGRIVPSVPTCQARNIYETFALQSPLSVIRKGESLEPEFSKNPGNTKLTRVLAFSKAPMASDEEILQRRNKSEKRKCGVSEEDTGNETAKAAELNAEDPASAEGTNKNAPCTSAVVVSETSSVKTGRGRKPGSKNKKTLEYEAKVASGEIVPEPPKKRGRPPGAKNKKTLQYEQDLRDGKIQPQSKGKPGRPAGKKDSVPRVRRTKKQILESQSVTTN